MKKKSPHEDKDCYYNRAQDALDEVGGRYSLTEPRRRIIGRDQYPEVSSPLFDHPENEDDFTNKVEEPISHTYGIDITRLAGVPPPGTLEAGLCSSHEPPTNLNEELSCEAPRLSFPGVVNNGSAWSASVGRGMTREFLGEFPTFELAVAAVKKAQKERGAA